MAKFEDIIIKESLDVLDETRGFICLIEALFDITSEQVGAMFDPPKAAHTIYGFKRRGFNEINSSNKQQVINFIEKWYKGKNPKDNLVKKINRVLLKIK